jgi:Domain of Unknown Function (DUF1206)
MRTACEARPSISRTSLPAKRWDRRAQAPTRPPGPSPARAEAGRDPVALGAIRRTARAHDGDQNFGRLTSHRVGTADDACRRPRRLAARPRRARRALRPGVTLGPGGAGRPLRAGGALRPLRPDRALRAGKSDLAGLFGFACWRITQAVFDVDNCGNDPGGVMRRLGFIGGAMFHLALAAIAINIVLGSRRVGDEDSLARDWTAWLLAQPFGMWIVMLIGTGITAAGAFFAWKAMKADFREHLATEMGGREWIVALGQFGFAARSVVFVLVGIFLIVAAWRFNSGEAAGLVGALRVLQQQAYGSFLLGFVALGLVSYGVFEILQVFARRVDAEKARRQVEKAAART